MSYEEIKNIVDERKKDHCNVVKRIELLEYELEFLQADRKSIEVFIEYLESSTEQPKPAYNKY